MPEELEPYPEAAFRDHVRVGVNAGVAAIPWVGSSLEVLVDAVIAPSLTKRRDAWLRKLHDLMVELHQKVDGFDPTSLAGDEVFVTAVADASRIAMGTHLEGKLDLLKNCLAHMAVDVNRDDFLDLQLFRIVDDLTPEHFVVLQYLDNPGAWFDAKQITRPQSSIGAPEHLMDAAALPVTGIARQIVVRDLSDRGLADTGSLGVTMSAAGAWRGMTTALGQELLDFVRTI